MTDRKRSTTRPPACPGCRLLLEAYENAPKARDIPSSDLARVKALEQQVDQLARIAFGGPIDDAALEDFRDEWLRWGRNYRGKV
ncbi:MAG: hypothetical protein ABIJ75_00095 [Actinomycetota bacterium]